MAESELIGFVVDEQDGVSSMDRELARIIRKLHKPVLLLVNEIDDSEHEPRADECSALGFEDVFPTSAAHGRGVPELLEKIENFLPAADLKAQISNLTHPIAVAILGRPNAGKSSVINALLGDRRAIVSEIPGTTRDAVDIEYEREGKRFLFIDTAGIRVRSKHSSSVEVFSVMRAEKTITRADICVLVIDAADGIKAQDRRIAALIQKARKACVIVLNKWDLVRTNRKQRQTMEAVIANARAELFFIDYASVLVTSALTGEHADKIFKMIERVRQGAQAHIGTGKLNRLLHAAIASNPPAIRGGKRLKLFYATQAPNQTHRPIPPPEFVLFFTPP